MNISTEQERFHDIQSGMTIGDRLMCPGELLRRASIMYADTPAVIYENNHITYRTLYQQSCAFAHVLIKQGVQPRDRVIISLQNSPAFYVAYCAAWHLGAVVTPVNIFLIESEIRHIIQDAQPAVCIVDSNRTELFQKAGMPNTSLLTQEDVLACANTWVQPPELIVLKPDECATLLYTSGTTGVPKGVMLSCRNIMTNIAQVIARLTIEHDNNDRVLAVLPLFHVYAQNTCFWSSFFAGVSVILIPKIDRHAIIDGLKHKPTLLVGVPALYGLLCLMKNAPLDSIRLFSSGGDMLPDKIRTGFALLYHRRILNGYGLTETSPVIATMMEDELTSVGTVGRPLIGISCEIKDEQGNKLPVGKSGILWVKGDNVMLGYYRAPDATRSVYKEGWFNTGDLAYIDRQGRIVFTGREKDLIVSKGFNVYPPEIENVVMQHPQVIAVGVIGCPAPDIGEYVVAYVQIKSAHHGIEKELKAMCANALAPYKIPRQFICTQDELPMTATRKIDKKILRKRCVAHNSQEDFNK
ncbi:MAG TPA: AMP-binding protein [Candidatus Babeliales bacterium]|nr:AMP-binding protein [Candidatus Babeliales bacterium]